MILLIVGYVAMLVGGIWLLVAAFKTSVGWGLASLFIPFAALVFVFKHWDVAKKPFLIQIGGIVLAVVGVVLSPQTMSNLPQ
jgi:hypothetical protein